MKKLHLICNSHIDPVWMWDWEEGLGTAISTYYQAAVFCKEYDYIFCHNEAILYEFIEQNDPTLFADITELVKAGKWHIMGGWYLQPDCNIPSGEAFVRQIKLGREYFEEKFGKRPTTAINFDSFGHTVGLVPILKKCGYDSYICCRPMREMLTLPDNEFWWVGKDGSKVKVARLDDLTLYCSGFGNALEDIKRKEKLFEGKEVGAALWGVGNHGGNPSRKDLNDVQEYIKSSDFEIVHSTPEQFFAEINPTAEWTKSLNPCLIGSYTSMSSIKQKHIELEYKLFETEKLCALAEMKGVYIKNQTPFTEAEKALACIQFHDVGSGTCAADGEKSSLMKGDYALELLKKEYNKAFFALISQEKKAGEGEFPFFVFNPQPYEFEGVVEMEYLMPDSLVSDTEQYTVTVKQNSQIIPSQCIKELSNINYDRRKRIAVRCELPAFEITRLDLTVEVTPLAPATVQSGQYIVVKDSCKKVVINKATGLMESYVVDGKEMLSGGAFQPVMYDDNADPWGWYMSKIGKNETLFVLSACDKGVFRGLENVKIIEDGDVLTEVESYFELESSYVRVSYKIYKDKPYTDVTVNAYWNERDKALKVKIPTALDGAFIGQIPFGIETYEKDDTEMTMQRFTGIEDGENAFVAYNDCTFGFSHDGNALYATLLRGAAYCAHPIGDRPLIKKNMFIEYIETGRRTFRFRMSYDKKAALHNRAQEFINAPLALNFFPHGKGRTDETVVKIADESVYLAACYQEKNGYVFRLVNSNETSHSCVVEVMGKAFEVAFGKYETKTYIYKDGTFNEKEIWY